MSKLYCMSHALKFCGSCSSSLETQFYFRDKNCCQVMASIPLSIFCYANEILCSFGKLSALP